MSHLDEGTLHALLDGELDLAEVSEVQKHLGSCVSCGSRLQEVKQVLAEADRLVGVVEVPAGAARQRPPEHKVAPEPARTQPPLRTGREHDMWDEPPVLLVPDPIDSHAWRTRWPRPRLLLPWPARRRPGERNQQSRHDASRLLPRPERRRGAPLLHRRQLLRKPRRSRPSSSPILPHWPGWPLHRIRD